MVSSGGRISPAPMFRSAKDGPWAITEKGRYGYATRNGVTMKLNTRRKGLQLSLGADGVVIAFKYQKANASW